MKIKLLGVFIGVLALWTPSTSSWDEAVEMPAEIFGSEPLGTLVLPDGTREPLTWRDVWWMGRTAAYEGGGSNPTEAASILWTYLQRRWFGTGPNLSSNLRDWPLPTLIRLHSQPVNPRWGADGEFCRPGGRYAGTDNCSPARLARRREAIQTDWGDLPIVARQVALAIAKGQLANPVPGSIDFAAPSLGLNNGFHAVRTGNNLYQGSNASISWGGRGLRVEPPRTFGILVSNLVPFGGYFSRVI